MSKKKMRVLFNDSHANLPWQKNTPQGGPARFARLFSSYFGKRSDVELVSLLFTHNIENNDIFSRRRRKDRDYYELVYPAPKIRNTYHEKYTKKEYLSFLKPWLKELEIILNQAKPDLVFLNGYSLSNWMLLEASHRLGIPTCIQHAGIWKKEISISQHHFSPSIRKIFNSLEKEIIKKANHQIFLNEFSRDVFFDVHGVEKRKRKFSDKKVSIVPLPISADNLNKITLEENISKIGVVARWDSIKNHSAVLRLAEYYKKQNKNISINVITSWAPNLASDFKDKYQKLVNIVAPMEIFKLNQFFKKQDMILVPSNFDVSPTVVAEALINGRPALISKNVGWVSDYERVGLTDLVFEPSAGGSSVDNKIQKLLINKDKYLPRFKKMQNYIKTEHNPNKVFAKYHKIFKSLI